MEEERIAISEVAWFGVSSDGQGVGFGFRTSENEILRFQCATDGLEDILNNLVALYDDANEKRGFKPDEAGDSGAARMHRIVAIQSGVTEHGMALLIYRTAANTYQHHALDLTKLAELDTAIRGVRSTIEGMAQSHKH